MDLDLCSSNVQDAFVIAVEQQARERLERLSALKRITPVDMTKLSQQVGSPLIFTFFFNIYVDEFSEYKRGRKQPKLQI